MGSDFSALDAELDQVDAGPEVDAVALANQYAGDLQVSLTRGAAGEELAAVDSALAELGAKVEPVEARASAPQRAPAARDRAPKQAAAPREAREPAFAEAAVSREGADDTGAFLRATRRSELPDVPSEVHDEPPASGVPPPSSARSSAPGSGPLESEEIALPEPVVRARSDEASQELPLDVAPRSGSFELDDEDAAASGRDLGPTASEPPAATMPAPAVADEDDEEDEEDEEDEGERAFAALFDEVTKQSSMPSPSASTELPDEDTEIFDSAAFARALQGSRGSPDVQEEVELGVEDLDSAEFEVLTETAVARANPPSSTPPRPSQPPEKRPSFLGRLFGRKEE